MTLGTMSDTASSAGGCLCSCCGAKMMPYFSDDAVVSQNQINHLIGESFLTVKGAALFLPRGNSPTSNSAPRVSQRRNKHTGDLQQHLHTMFTVLRPEDNIRLAVRLESAYPLCTRYMVVVSTAGRQDTEESIVLGVDFPSSDSCCTVGLVLPLWSDTLIHLDGDGGFSVSTVNRVHVFKPVSVQAMWSALQSLHKACEVARGHNYYPGSLFLTWVSYYQSRVSSDQHCINEWNAMQDVQSHRADSPVLFADVPTERERTERLIKTRLREIMMQKDLENVTSKEIRIELEMQMVCNLREFKEFIDKEMIVILGQMDSPTEIFDHVFLGSEWNASNLEELHNSGVRYILNVTREIDNFFPGMFEYHNIRVYDEETTNLLEYWNDTFKFITKAKKAGAKCLVHCKMGVSRSASTVIAYAMKEYDWDLDTAFHYVKERRGVTKPNPSFMRQLEEYQGILLASKQRHNKLWRSHSESDLSDRPEPLCKPASHSPVHSDTQNNNTTTTPSLQQLLGIAVLQALSAEPREPALLPTVAEHPPDAPILLLLPPLPRPRAATVVPVSVALSVPAAVSHPPPTLHVLPPTPQPQQASLGPPPAHRPGGLSLDLPERSSSLEGSLSGSASPLSPLSPVSPLSPGTSDDDDNNPAGSPGRPTDSIDFFSAREKFVGLAQDGRARALSEPAQQRTPPPTSLPLENRGDLTPKKELEDDESSPLCLHHTQPSHHHDNGISVRHIVTEIESISQPGCSIPGAVAAPPGGPRSPRSPRSPPADARQPPSTPRGSVRRATRQLEQRLRQERSPLHSPTSAEPPPPPLKPSPCPPSSPQEGSLSAEPHTHPPYTASGGPAPPPASPVAVHASRSPSPDAHDPPHTGLRSLGQQQSLGDTDPQRGVTLEGVTARESDTDGGPGAACVAPGPQRWLACSSQELERVQQTLRELQAFLREAGGAVETLSGDSGQDEAPREAPREAMDTECPAPGTKDRQGKSFRQPAGWRRTVELEARIRQAGLTPPSLMKRSASLAKLDRLELSANELSDWDLSPPPPREPPSSHDDAWKKQRVLVQIPRIEHTSWSRQGGRRPREPSSSPPSPLPGESQQTRAHHSSRRGRKVSSEKKQRAALYNTM